MTYALFHWALIRLTSTNFNKHSKSGKLDCVLDYHDDHFCMQVYSRHLHGQAVLNGFFSLPIKFILFYNS